MDFNLPSETTNLANIFEKVKFESEKRMKINNYNLKYSDLYNVKTEKIYKDKQVIGQIEEYCNYLKRFLMKALLIFYLRTLLIITQMNFQNHLQVIICLMMVEELF